MFWSLRPGGRGSSSYSRRPFFRSQSPLQSPPHETRGSHAAVSCNDLSEISAILALVALCRLWTDLDAQSKKNRYRLLFVASITTLIITQTRGTFAAFLIGLVVLLALTRRYWVLVVGGILGAAVGALLLMFTNFSTTVMQVVLRGEAVHEASGLSGRLEVWQLSIHKILERPFIGYGGFAGSRFVVLAKDSPWSDALNTYVDATLNIGIWGFLLLVILVFSIGWVLFRSVHRSSLKQSERYLAMELSLAYTVVIIRSMESGNLITHPMLAFLALLSFAEFLRRRDKSSSYRLES